MLVVEDEFIIGLDLAETVSDLGYKVDGPHSGNKGAFRAIGEHMPDFAILDIFTDDGEVYPLADALTAAGVPIVFHSGHVPPAEVRERYPNAQAASKPCPPSELIDMIRKAIGTTH
ncbi:response regulator [Alteraurantiacibacter aquimixticola]|uniref:Response regulator n=1 Tax=Alteraurantiacibacter aquimixticola TaxID=2489173 RepID=A0A4V4U979_9SPHN|nr:response regulator [Alteraurantiacibacter aquimixticola]